MVDCPIVHETTLRARIVVLKRGTNKSPRVVDRNDRRLGWLETQNSVIYFGTDYNYRRSSQEEDLEDNPLLDQLPAQRLSCITDCANSSLLLEILL